ncbi:NAD(P)-dependent oxidoreductase [Streptomyces sp. NPDC097640]|uniref:NAD-dependent epimerase/dehydratase family protein n=1 Tax=Streptomyces sp. NPDC097640 TaxID=3157229 RepID=UPI00331864EC
MTPRLTVVVLGGTGFLGRHIREAFETDGAHVLGVSRSAPVRLELTRASTDRLRGLFAEADADVVVNATGLIWGADEAELTAVNATAVARLVEAVAGLNRRVRLVHLGSVHEYGPVPPGTGITEDVPQEPATVYGRSKLLGSRAVLDAAHAGAVDGTVLRIANVYGPGAPRASVLGGVAHHLAAIARGRKTAGGPGDAPGGAPGGGPVAPLRLAPMDVRRDFVDVRDVAEAVLAATSAPSVSGQAVNIGRGQAVGVRPLVDRMIALSGLAVPVLEEPRDDARRPDAEWQRMDISRARRLLGWQPRRGVDESLRDQLAAQLAGV